MSQYVPLLSDTKSFVGTAGLIEKQLIVLYWILRNTVDNLWELNYIEDINQKQSDLIKSHTPS